MRKKNSKITDAYTETEIRACVGLPFGIIRIGVPKHLLDPKKSELALRREMTESFGPWFGDAFCIRVDPTSKWKSTPLGTVALRITVLSEDGADILAAGVLDHQDEDDTDPGPRAITINPSDARVDPSFTQPASDYMTDLRWINQEGIPPMATTLMRVLTEETEAYSKNEGAKVDRESGRITDEGTEPLVAYFRKYKAANQKALIPLVTYARTARGASKPSSNYEGWNPAKGATATENSLRARIPHAAKNPLDNAVEAINQLFPAIKLQIDFAHFSNQLKRAVEAPTPLLNEDGQPDSRFAMFRAVAVRRTDSNEDVTLPSTIANVVFQNTQVAVVATDTVIHPNVRVDSVVGTVVVHKLITGLADPAKLSRMLAPALRTTSLHIAEWQDPDHSMEVQEWDLYVVDGELSTTPPGQENSIKIVSLDDNLAGTENRYMKTATELAQESASKQSGTDKKLQDLLNTKEKVRAMDLDDRLAQAEEALETRKRQREADQEKRAAAHTKATQSQAQASPNRTQPQAPAPKQRKVYLLVTHTNTGLLHQIDPDLVPCESGANAPSFRTLAVFLLDQEYLGTNAGITEETYNEADIKVEEQAEVRVVYHWGSDKFPAGSKKAIGASILQALEDQDHPDERFRREVAIETRLPNRQPPSFSQDAFVIDVQTHPSPSPAKQEGAARGTGLRPERLARRLDQADEQAETENPPKRTSVSTGVPGGGAMVPPPRTAMTLTAGGVKAPEPPPRTERSATSNPEEY